MGEVDVQMLFREVRGLRKEIATLMAIVKKDKVFDAWIDECTAAEMLGMQPRTLRRKCTGYKKKGVEIAPELPINYRNTNGRSWQYSRKDIKAFMQNTSTQI